MTSAPIETTRRGTPAGWLLKYLENKGLEQSNICGALNVSPETLISETGIMPLKVYMRLLQWASGELDDPLLGVDLAKSIEPFEYGFIGHLTKNGRTLKEIFSFFERYLFIYSPEFSFRFSYTKELGKCTYEAIGTSSEESRVDIDFSLALVVLPLRVCGGENWHPIKCCFSYQEPEDTSLHQQFFGPNLLFNQPQSTVEFEAEFLETINPNTDSGLLPILLNQANQLLDKLQEQDDIVHKIRLLITASLGYYPITTEIVAERMNVSVRHLHRLLKEKGTSFRTLKEDTVLQTAKEALIESDLSVTEIAQRLGYSETSALARVFKKHTGHAPLSYRQQFTR